MGSEKERGHGATEAGRRPCGLYRTTEPIEGKIAAGVLVYYHNHGDPGPGVYPVERWVHNRAIFARRGYLVPDERWVESLEPLPPQGFYRVVDEFWCCEQHCHRFKVGTLVQLGYNGRGDPILFLPVLTDRGLELPERGNVLDRDKLGKLERLEVAERFESRPDPSAGGLLPGLGKPYLH